MGRSAPAEAASRAFRRGLDELGAGRLGRARRALAIAVRRGGGAAGWAGQELIQSFLREGRSAEAGAALARLLPPGSPQLEHGRGYLAWRLGQGQAEAHLEQALRLAPTFVPALAELGRIRMAKGGDGEGEALLLRAGRLAARRGDDWGRATVLGHRGGLALKRMQLAEAARLFARSLALRERLGDVTGASRMLSNLGTVSYYLADYAAAMDFLERSIAGQRRGRDHQFLGWTWINLANCYLELSEPERASEALRRALAVCRRAGDRRGEAAALSNLGLARALAFDLAGAERTYSQALGAAAASTPDERGAAVADLARIRLRRGRPRAALAALAELRTPATSLNPRTRLVLAVERARALIALGRTAAAARALAGADAALTAVPGPWRRLLVPATEAEVLRATLALAGGDPAAAVRGLRRAARRIEQLLAALRRPFLRLGVHESWRELHDALVVACLAGGRPRAAWRVASSVKARLLREALAGDRRPATPAFVQGLEARIRLLVSRGSLDRAGLHELRVLRRRYREQEERRGPFGVEGPRAGVEGPQVGVEGPRAGMEGPQVGVEGPRVGVEGPPGARPSRGGTAPSPPAGAAAPRLAADTALVEYHVASDRTLVFVWQQQGLAVVTVTLGDRALAGRIRRLLAPLWRAGLSRHPAAVLDGYRPGAARSLARALIDPVLDRLAPAVSRLLIVPDGALHELPFELLPLGPHRRRREAETAGAEGGPFLGDACVLSYLPASGLPALPFRQGRRGRPPRRLLALGFSPRPGSRLSLAGESLALGPLPGVGRELAAIARSFPGADIRRGDAASLRAFLTAAPAAFVVHLAAHGLTERSLPGLAGLVLAGPGRRGGLDVLTADAIARTRLSATLVTLSGCSTAAGRLRRREGVLSLARAFLAAGAEAVLAARWPVEDAVGRTLFASFYRQLVTGVDLAEALRSARAQARAAGAAGGRAHPFFWAPFVLYERSPPPQKGQPAGS